MRRLATLLLCATLVTTTGCLGTVIDAPPQSRAGPSYQTLRWHLLAAPTLIRVDGCEKGLSDVTTFVPPWGLAIGILTFGIVVPQWTILSCAAGD